MPFCPRCGAANDGPGGFCRACGHALSAAGTAVGAAPAPIPPPPKKKMNTGLKVILILLLVFVVLPFVGSLIFGFYAAFKYGSNSKPFQDACHETSYSYLYSLQHGDGASSSYWKPNVTPMALIAVHSFKVLVHGEFSQRNGQPYKVPRVYYEYEVESSNEAGMPLRKHWDIVMEPDSKNVLDKPCAIVEVGEAR